MLLIDFGKMTLASALKNQAPSKLKFVSETHSDQHGMRVKQLDFVIDRFDLGVRLLVIENDQGVELQVQFENVCKNIDLNDQQMDLLIQEISDIAWSVEALLLKQDPILEKLALTRTGLHMDPIVLRKTRVNNTLEIAEQAISALESMTINEPGHSHYPQSLVLFGGRGLLVAEALKAAELADYKKQNSGYLLKFYESCYQGSDAHMTQMARSLSDIGIPVMALPVGICKYFW